MIKRILFAFAFVALFSFNSNAQKIAVVDINQVLENLEEYQTAQDDLDRMSAKWKRQIAEEYDKIKGLYNRYQADQVLLSEDVRKEREDEIMAKEKEVREMQKRKFGADGEMFKKRQELVRPIQDKVYAAIEDYADARGYDLVFDKGGSSGLLFTSENYDKTDDILKRLGVE